MFFFDPWYFVILAPALLLGAWAQARVRSTYQKANQIPAPLSGAAAAQHILDSAGLQHVGIEETHGMLSDHFDPRENVLRLSSEVYHNRSAAAVGIAAHEAGHAIQFAERYAPLVVRNAAVPAARVGPWLGIGLMLLGVFINSPTYSAPVFLTGVAVFGTVVFFQLVNLPVEFDASNRAKRLLVDYGITSGESEAAVRSVLNAAAWTYVAATLQTILTLLYYILRLSGGVSRD
ncbi:MAG: zinc metallopeptidase [Planctomycetota bacterium]|nr:MAG: zinc metallopeptidase [Planctomycetota bacterium]REJ87384.1 MAG: zinc metallopeptidase [Planctomycetota bacterium]REK27315.1 MAG: zinc metallopeptidase [Planctomycetota bacterium]REK36664.1 MAG: zinc metallopeptidase [Planctomycetota bacterium]